MWMFSRNKSLHIIIPPFLSISFRTFSSLSNCFSFLCQHRKFFFGKWHENWSWLFPKQREPGSFNISIINNNQSKKSSTPTSTPLIYQHCLYVLESQNVNNVGAFGPKENHCPCYHRHIGKTICDKILMEGPSFFSNCPFRASFPLFSNAYQV